MKIVAYIFGSNEDWESTRFRASDLIMTLPQFRLDVAKTILPIKRSLRLELFRFQIAQRTCDGGELFEVSFTARADYQLKSPVLFTGELQSQQNPGRQGKESVIFSGGEHRRAAAVSLHAGEDSRKVIRLDDEDKVLNH